MKNAKIKNRQKLGMLVATMVLVLLMTLIAGMLTGCGKNTARSTDGTESSSAGGNGSAGGGKGRFIESKVALPEEINSILQFKALSDGTLEVVGQDADYGIYVAKSSDGGGSWETTPLEDISYSNVAVAEDGTVAFLDYTENGLCPVTIVDADGSTHTFSIEMPAEDAFVSVAAFDSNKQLIVRDTLGGLYGIDCTDGSKTVTFEIDEDTYIPYFDVVGTNCYIVTSDKVLCYDTTTGKETDELTALTEQICSDDNLVYRNPDTGLPVTFAKAENDNSIFFADYKGIFHYTTGGAVVEELVQGEQTALSNSGAVFYGVYMQDETHLFVAGNNGMEGALYSYTYDADASANLNQELNIYALQDSDTLRQAVIIFRQEYADIYVNLEIGMTDDNGVTLEDALKTLSTDILAGNGPDVLILDGMPVDSYVEKGILTDISDVVDEVKASDGLVDSIVKDSTKDGKIYAIPTRFLVSFITSDQQTVDAGKSTQALADRIETLAKDKSTTYVVQQKMAEELLLDFYNVDSQNWVKEDGSLDETKVSDYLTQVKRIYDVDDHSDIESYGNFFESGMCDGYRYGTLDSMDLFAERCKVEFGTIADVEDFQLMLSAGTTDGAVYGVLSNGGTSSYVPFLQAGVVSGGNVDAGKAFVKTLLGKEAGASSNGIPVNEAALKDQINALMGWTETSMAFNRDGSDKMYTIEYRSMTQEEADAILAQLEAVEQSALTDRTIQNLVIERGTSYVKGEQNLEETVNEITKKVNLYLAEQQ